MIADQENAVEVLEERLDAIEEEMLEAWSVKYDPSRDEEKARERYEELMQEKDMIEHSLGYSNEFVDVHKRYDDSLDQHKRAIRAVMQSYGGQLHVIGSRMWRMGVVRRKNGSGEIEGVKTLCNLYLTEGGASTFSIHPDDERACSECMNELTNWKEEEYEFDPERYIGEK